MTATGCLADARANTATDTTLVVLGAVCWLDAIEFHHLPFQLRAKPFAAKRWLVSQSIFLEHFDQIADLVDHPSHFRRIHQFLGAADLAQAQSTHGGTV